MKWLVGVVVILGGLLSGATVGGVKAAVAVHENKKKVGEIQELKQSIDKVNAQWTQLLIEQKMLVDNAAITRAVQAELDMRLPEATQVVYLH